MTRNQQIKNLITEACRRTHYSERDLFRQLSGISFGTFKKRLDDPMSFSVMNALQISVALDFTEEETQILYGRKANEKNIKRVYE